MAGIIESEGDLDGRVEPESFKVELEAKVWEKSRTLETEVIAIWPSGKIRGEKVEEVKFL